VALKGAIIFDEQDRAMPATEHDYHVTAARSFDLRYRSMGAFGAWDLAVATPDRFAALLAISGGGNPVEVCQLKDVPVWIVHGRQDDVIPVSWSEALAGAWSAAAAT
jgi:predicted peptidase